MIHDVAVLGGGIAGAAAALRLARGGARPLWITPERRQPFKPGEHLSAAALPMLKTLGSDAMLRAEVHRHAHSTYSAWGSDTLIERNAIVQLEGPPTVLDRIAFEDALSDQAVAAGARRIVQSVSGADIVKDCWHMQVGQDRLAARFVFDATGRKAIIAARQATRFQADKLGCQYALLTSRSAERARPVTLIEAEERGWWYLSLRADGRAVVNFYTDTDIPAFDNDALLDNATRTKSIGAYLADYGFDRSGTVRRTAANSSWLAPAIGPGWAAIGDAAAAFDPLSSHGMTTALWTAIQASEAYLARDRAKMQAYAQAVASGVQAYLETRQAVYARETRWPQSVFWARRHVPDRVAV